MTEQGDALQPTEIDIHPEWLSIATTTLYPDWYPGAITEDEIVAGGKIGKVRGDLALQTIRTALTKGYQVSVVDDGSSAAFRDALQAVGVAFTEVGGGMSSSRREVFRLASMKPEAKIVCWTEPEKAPLVMAGGLKRAAQFIIEGKADIVIPKRTVDGFASYPKYQQEFEAKGNRQFNALLKSANLLPQNSDDLDFWFGPRLIRNDPQLLELFQRQYAFTGNPGVLVNKRYKPELWPNTTFLPVIAALHDGYNVTGVEVPYIHPRTQTISELDNAAMDDKRRTQLVDIIGSAIHLIRQYSDNPETRAKSKLQRI